MHTVKSSRWANGWLWLVYGALSVYFTYPLLASGDRLGIQDWDALLFQHAAVVRSVYEFGQWPFWNPWYCGGNVLWQNPQTPLLTPVYLLAPFVSVALAMKLTILLHYIVGFAGMHFLLTRVFGITWRPLILYLAALFVLAGGMALRLVVGHSAFLPYFYLPWLLLFYVRAIDTRDRRFVVGTALVLTLALYAGGLHMTFMAGFSLALFSIAAAVTRKEWRPIGVLAVTGLLSGLLVAPKLAPMLAYVTDARLIDQRWFHKPDLMTAEMVLRAFMDPFQYPRMLMHAQKYGWHEYGNYLGFLGAPLICAAFIWLVSRRPRLRERWLVISLAVTAAVLVGLMFGEAGRFAPYVWLSKLPVMSQFRLPSRYTLVFLLFAVGVVAAVIREGMAGGEIAPGLRRFTGILLVLATVSLAYQNRTHFPGAFPLSPAHLSVTRNAPTIDATTSAFEGDSPMVRAMANNRAILKCNEPLLLPGRVAPARNIVFADGDARLSDITFTPNRVAMGVVTGQEEARVILNSKYTDGWYATHGTLTLDEETGLPYVSLPPFTATHLEFRFFPERLVTGLVLFLTGVMIAIALWRLQKRRAQGDIAPEPDGRPA